MYAIIEDKGRQYSVQEGDLLLIDLREAAAKESIVFDRVLFLRTDAETRVGRPTVDGARVTATVLGEVKGPKVIIRKFRRRKNYRRKNGHRQRSLRIRIESIEA